MTRVALPSAGAQPASPLMVPSHLLTATIPIVFTQLIDPVGFGLAEEPRAVGDLVHVEKFFARNLGGLIHARTCVPGRLGKATSRTPSMYVDEKSDEAIVLAKRPNKGRQLPAEVVEGRASPKGNSR
jgi:hypothetical protein